MNFETRADLSEWMDAPCTYEDFRACLRDLVQSNRITLNNRPTLQWLQSLAAAQHPLHIVDVGSGGGDMLRQIERWANREGVAVRLTGIDLNPYAAQAALEMSQGASIKWVTGDAFSYQPDEPIDVVISSLFTHHLPDNDIVRFLAWMERVAQRGWFINDLHRERMPYYGYQLLSRVMRWHRFVRHDGPISIRRAFQPADWRAYLTHAGIALDAAQIKTIRPARLCVSRVKP
jgi:trans-aconitate methyltransferase